MLHSLLWSTGATVGVIVVAVVLVLAIAILIWWINTRNDFVRLKNRVEEGMATIDVYLKKRFDLIPNLVETVKGYAKHESETLEKVVAARNLSMGAKTAEEKMAAANNLSSSLRTLFTAISESYPQLHANTNFLDLQSQLKNIEGELEGARRYYNGVVKTFYKQARVILRHKRLHGPLQSLFQLSLYEEFTNDQLKRIEPYVSF